MPDIVAIALSGGIDSLVAAGLLKAQGYQLIGLHFLTGFESTAPNPDMPRSTSLDSKVLNAFASEQLAPMVAQLDIPIEIIDLRTEFRRLVIDYFCATYQAGKTPNPCLVCNPSIKFGVLFNRARSLGATRLATGHYACVRPGADGRMHLLRGADPSKDQSYFLARLSQEQLRQAVLPLAGIAKSQTRRIAQKMGLQPAAQQESQDICFIRNGSYRNFLQNIPGFSPYPGMIEDLSGRSIGRHSGLYRFTIGQRRGINCPADEPYYVIRIDVARNVLVVGPRRALGTRRFRVSRINWIIPPPTVDTKVLVRIRYRHAAVAATVIPLDDANADVCLEQSEPAVTPGQGAVFYQGEEVLGGGWIQ
jgi:tRNA-uridine 2-sulfurtransferase